MRLLFAVAALTATALADDIAYSTALSALSAGATGTTAVSTGSLPFATVACKDSTKGTHKNQTVLTDPTWDNAYVTEAFELANMEWFRAGVSSTYTFPEFISKYFGGLDTLNCGDTAPEVNCDSMTKCTDFDHPAGQFLVNSFVSVHEFLWNFYDAFTRAESDMLSSMGTFAATFAAIEDVEAEIEMILNVIGLGYALMVAPIWNKFLKELPAFKSSSAGNWLGTTKDAVNGMVSNGITIIKSSGTWAVSQNNQNLLSDYMGQMIKSWGGEVSQTNEDLFNGSLTSIASLWHLIDEGGMVASSTTGTLDIITYIEQALYAVLMPYAWSLSNQNSHPFVMDTGYDCSNVWPDLYHDYLNEDTAKAMNICIDNKLYYLLDARYCQQKCVSSTQTTINPNLPLGVGQTCTPVKFYEPLGVDTLDGTQWGGITIQNIVQSVVNGYNGNGGANGWSVADPTSDAVWDNGIEAGGVFNIPMCSWAVAETNWANCDINADNYPCQPLS